MGVPLRLVSLPDKTHFDCLLLQDHKPETPQTQWLRVQDQRRPRRVAPTFLLSSPRGKSRSSRKLSVSWTQTKTVFCLPQTLLPPSTLLANPSPMVRPKACSQKPPDPSTPHRWLCFSQRRWPEVLMMMTPSSRLSMPLKSTAKSTQICSNTPSCPKLQRAKKTKKTKFSSKLGPHRLLAVKK